jgi:hypothetical protein
MVVERVCLDCELDLHEHTWQEALSAFVSFYNEALQFAAGDPAPTLNVIHGYGSQGSGGVLRKRLQKYLQEQSAQGRLDYTPGEHVDANPGHTLVAPISHLPDANERLGEEILAYCERPRTLSKIYGKFRRHGEPTVRAALESLVRQRRLRTTGKGNRKTYEAEQ